MRQLGLGRIKPTGQAQPRLEEITGGITLQHFQERILPALVTVPLPEMEP
jgi:hypothetical protein